MELIHLQPKSHRRRTENGGGSREDFTSIGGLESENAAVVMDFLRTASDFMLPRVAGETTHEVFLIPGAFPPQISGSSVGAVTLRNILKPAVFWKC